MPCGCDFWSKPKNNPAEAKNLAHLADKELKKSFRNPHAAQFHLRQASTYAVAAVQAGHEEIHTLQEEIAEQLAASQTATQTSPSIAPIPGTT